MARSWFTKATTFNLHCGTGLEGNPVISRGLIWKPEKHHGSQGKIFFSPKVFMSTPRIIQKKDRNLDEAMEIEKKVRPVFQIRDMILKAGTEGLRLKNVERKRRDLSLKSSQLKPTTYIKRYPNIFEVYMHSKERGLYCRLTKEVIELLEEEKRIYAEQEPVAVERLRRLLMIFSGRRILASKLESVRRDFGFADDFLVDMVPRYPDFFRIVKSDTERELLELVMWDESLAVSAFERKAKEEARQMGSGEIETRGRPLGFKLSLSPGMNLRRRILELLEEWQNLPYISPYQDASLLKHGTPLLEKRNVAVLHEFLWLTVEKRLQMNIISNFRTELGLPQKPPKLIARFPGIFYVSHKGAVQTCILREGYHESKLVEESPFVQLKVKYAEMVRVGPLLKSMMKQKKDGKELDNLVSEPKSYEDGLPEKDSNEEEESDEDTLEGLFDDDTVSETKGGQEDASHSDVGSETEDEDRFLA